VNFNLKNNLSIFDSESIDEALERIPALSDRLRIMYLRVAHVAHCDHIAALGVALEVGDRHRRQVNCQDLLDHVVVYTVHFHFGLDVSLLDRLLLLASLVFEDAAESELAGIQLLNILLNVFDVSDGLRFAGLERLHVSNTRHQRLKGVLLLLDPVANVDERVAELSVDRFQLRLQIILAVARNQRDVCELANLARLFVLGLLVSRQESRKLLVVLFFGLLDGEHAAQFLVE